MGLPLYPQIRAFLSLRQRSFFLSWITINTSSHDAENKRLWDIIYTTPAASQAQGPLQGGKKDSKSQAQTLAIRKLLCWRNRAAEHMNSQPLGKHGQGLSSHARQNPGTVPPSMWAPSPNLVRSCRWQIPVVTDSYLSLRVQFLEGLMHFRGCPHTWGA